MSKRTYIRAYMYVYPIYESSRSFPLPVALLLLPRLSYTSICNRLELTERLQDDVDRRPAENSTRTPDNPSTRCEFHITGQY